MQPDSVPYSIPVPNNMGLMRYVLALSVVVAHFNEPRRSRHTLARVELRRRRRILLPSAASHLRQLPPPAAPRQLYRAHAASCRPTPQRCSSPFVMAAVSSLPAIRLFHKRRFWAYPRRQPSASSISLHPTLPESRGYGHPCRQRLAVDHESRMVPLPLRSPCLPPAATLQPACTHRSFKHIYILSVVYRLGMLQLYDYGGRRYISYSRASSPGQLDVPSIPGVFCYFYFSTLMRRRLAVAAVSLAVLLLLPHAPCGSTSPPQTQQHSAVFVIVCSMSGPALTREGRRDNISYNIYLVHYPLVQLCAWFSLTHTSAPGPPSPSPSPPP